MKIYISLPITGHDEMIQRRKARLWQSHFRNRGHEVINPFDVSDVLDNFHKDTRRKPPTYREYMDEDLKELAECTHIFFIEGWQNSKGCIEEAEFSIENNINVLFEKKL